MVFWVTSVSFNGFLTNRKQRVVLNGQHLSWTDIKGVLLEGSILGPVFFLLHINEPTEDSNSKLFADNTSLFSIVNNAALSNSQLAGCDLTKIDNWA